eukprot:8298-Heterococcus_DN1.PRE.1
MAEQQQRARAGSLVSLQSTPQVLTVESVRGSVYAMSGDQMGCRASTAALIVPLCQLAQSCRTRILAYLRTTL